MFTLDESLVKEAILDCEHRQLHAAWWHAESFVESFSDRREAFLLILRRLLESGKFRLHDFQTNQPLTGSIQEQVNLFDVAMPKTGEEVDSLFFDKSKHPPEAWPDDLGNGVLMDFWFAGKPCPGYAVWLSESPDGIKEWIVA